MHVLAEVKGKWISRLITLEHMMLTWHSEELERHHHCRTQGQAHLTLFIFPTKTGKILYEGAEIQLLDLPGIIEGASQGKGRGRQVIAVAKTSDLILMMLDATKGTRQRELLEKELEAVGIRVNREKPNIYFKVRSFLVLILDDEC